jgi:hypothetical protein
MRKDHLWSPGPAHSFQGPQGEPDNMGPLVQLFFICDGN